MARIQVLDVARGFAVLGILLANIPSLGGPDLTRSFQETGALKGTDAWVDAFTTAFAAGKMRSILALLFGCGLALQFGTVHAAGKSWPGTYVKRMGWLALIGLIHGVFIWYGDILLCYALTGMIAAQYTKLSIKWSVGTMIVIGAGALLLGLGASAFALIMGSGGGMKLELWPFQVRHEIAAIGGPYWAGFPARFVYWLVAASTVVTGFLPFALALFLGGMMLQHYGVLERPSAFPKVRNLMLGLGLGLGLPLNLSAFFLVGAGNREILSASWELIFGPLLAVGLLMGIACLVESGRLRGLTSVFARVGRVSLSVYLLQSVLGFVIFSGAGFGQFGKLDRLGLIGVTLGMWAAVILFAFVWTSRFAMGPVEWVWRSLADGKKRPLRLAKSEVAAV